MAAPAPPMIRGGERFGIAENWPASRLPKRCAGTSPFRIPYNSITSGAMASRDNILIGLTPEVLLKAYACGIFPMAENADDPALFWIDPPKRGIIPLDAFHIPTRLARTVRNTPFSVVCNRDFDAVIEACAAPGPKRARTWINARIRSLYRDLFGIGHCHTVEVYDGARLVGGLYGVSLGRAFFGESMFHLERDCSKIALVHLVGRMKAAGYRL